MTDRRYAVAGWLSIAMAVFLPLLFAFGLAEAFIGKHMLGVGDSRLGLHHLVTAILAAAIVFILLTLRGLLNRSYSFTRADRPLMAAAVWYILFTIGSFFTIMFADTTWPAPSESSVYAMLIFWVVSMTSAGIIDIFLGLRLLQMKERMNEPMKVFSVITLVSGILELTVVLSPLALVMMPVWCVTGAMVFLRERDEEKIL
jgi:hypothetical protein